MFTLLAGSIKSYEHFKHVLYKRWKYELIEAGNWGLADRLAWKQDKLSASICGLIYCRAIHCGSERDFKRVNLSMSNILLQVIISFLGLWF